MNAWARTRAILTLRGQSSSLESTVIADAVRAVWPGSNYKPAPNTHYVIFVHGYNNTYGEARASYASARWWLEHLQTSVHVLELHWPGDSKRRFVRALAFPEKIAVAEDCGKLLSDWIGAAPASTTFSFVGHSLGCRLVLHAIKGLRRNNQIYRIRTACLMAAAVPVSSIVKEGLGPRGNESLKWRILFSRGDTVLSRWFAPGQLVGAVVYRKARLGIEAIGLYGEPETTWTIEADRWELYDARKSLEETDYYDHGWYWPGGRNHLRKASRTSSNPEPHDDISGRGLKNSGESSELVAQLLDARIERRIRIRPPLPARTLFARYIGSYFGG
jgi:predicted alpha/beta hydrolase family esterase